MKNILDKIVLVASNIKNKMDRILVDLDTNLISNLLYNDILIMCDLLSGKYLVIKLISLYPLYLLSLLCSGGYLFKCQIGDVIYSGIGAELILKDGVFWDKASPADSLQTTLTVIDNYTGSLDYKHAYGIGLNKNIRLYLSECTLKALNIYNKGILEICGLSGKIFYVQDIINYNTLIIETGVTLDSCANIDNRGEMYIKGGIILSNIDAMRTLTNRNLLIINGGSIGNIIINCIEGSIFKIDSGDIDNVTINLSGVILINSGISDSLFNIRLTSSIKISGSVEGCSFNLYGNKTYDFNEFIDGMWENIEDCPIQNCSFRCYLGATLINLDGNNSIK